MKKVKCNYKNCFNRRIHFEKDELRKHQYIEVPNSFNEKCIDAYCSIECYLYDKYLKEESKYGKNAEK